MPSGSPSLWLDTPIKGVGLFSGAPAELNFCAGTGLSFQRRTNGWPSGRVPAHADFICTDTSWSGLPAGVPIRNTTLKRVLEEDECPLAATVEHVLAACAGLGLWNATVTLEGGPEVPILDGSALPFVNALRPHAARASGVPPLTLREPIEVRQADAFIRAEPFDGIHYTYSLDYGHASSIPSQDATWQGDPNDFAINIAPARTFSLLKEAQAARAAGLFAHLTPRDMLVIADDGHPIDNAWRLDHEPAKHKLLDLIGDLTLLGRPLHAKVTAHRAGHALTHDFCRRVLTTESH